MPGSMYCILLYLCGFKIVQISVIYNWDSADLHD